jgi:serine/threonine protein phosphatase 1
MRYYAIGDVHGEADRLARLHDAIAQDHAREGGAARIVHLGDLIDRGPDSRGVVARVMALEALPPAGAQSSCVLGNHELMMLDAYDASDGHITLGHWLSQGGMETMDSYVAANGSPGDWRESVDRAHWDWLLALPSMIREERFVFVHGGIDPKAFPHCKEEIRLWTRSARFFDSESWPEREELKDILVVHGHTPTEDFAPQVQRRRINVDTGAVFGGPLTCAVLTPAEPPRFLFA